MESPKLFISYSWTSPEHEEWVLRLGTELREKGIDVILDKWDLKEGHDANAFMEKMVTDPEIKKVIMVCDKAYAEKADKRKGGVGTEAQIISKEVYDKVDQNKFVAVIAEKDEVGKPYLPTYYKSRIYIDLSDDEAFIRNFEQLLRWIYDKPLYRKPEIGNMPDFINDGGVKFQSSLKFKQVIEAIRSNKSNATGVLYEYFDFYIERMEEMRINDNNEGEFDDKVVQSIDDFLPARNELIEVLHAISIYKREEEVYTLLHCFFDSLVKFLDRPEYITEYKEWDFDNYRFVIHELFLYSVALFLKYEWFDAVSYLLRNKFIYRDVNSGYNKDEMKNFRVFYRSIQSLERRNRRLNIGTRSLRATMLKERCNLKSVSFNDLMQADFILFIRDVLDNLRAPKLNYEWYPETLLFKAVERNSGGRAFAIFMRAEKASYLEKIMPVLGCLFKDQLDKVVEVFQDGLLPKPRWQEYEIDVKSLLNFDKLPS